MKTDRQTLQNELYLYEAVRLLKGKKSIEMLYLGRLLSWGRGGGGNDDIDNDDVNNNGDDYGGNGNNIIMMIRRR